MFGPKIMYNGIYRTNYCKMGFFLSLNKNKHRYQFHFYLRSPFWVPINGLRVELDLDFFISTNTFVHMGIKFNSICLYSPCIFPAVILLISSNYCLFSRLKLVFFSQKPKLHLLQSRKKSLEDETGKDFIANS